VKSRAKRPEANIRQKADVVRGLHGHDWKNAQEEEKRGVKSRKPGELIFFQRCKARKGEKKMARCRSTWERRGKKKKRIPPQKRG